MQFLKQAEIFAFLAAVFLIGVIFTEKQRQENPPIIILSEHEESFRFALGSARIPDAFRAALDRQIVPWLDELVEEYRCDTIEVVGHTDGAPIRSTVSNLDEKAAAALRQRGGVEELTPGSNADLGLMRAMSIIELLRAHRQQGRLRRVVHFLPFSAGQIIQPDRRLVTEHDPDPSPGLRRIELRLLKLKERPIEEVRLTTGGGGA